uniref:Transmembrane protein 119b n=1 Tax=Gasterosteus aculeatus aculeatus TaxID=481459 RepID=G3PXS6_GASAC
ADVTASRCLQSSIHLSTPLPFYSVLEGSADGEEPNIVTSSVPTSNLSTPNQTTPVGPTPAETHFLNGVVDFLEENMLLILVAGSFILLFFLLICGAIVMSHRRKVNTYYPSSFPSKMYVDHRDKTGDAKLFNEVPEKPAPEQESEPVDSHKQLQADIMRAAKRLRTPNKCGDAAGGSDPSQKVADQSLSEDSRALFNIYTYGRFLCCAPNDNVHRIPSTFLQKTFLVRSHLLFYRLRLVKYRKQPEEYVLVSGYFYCISSSVTK